MIDVGVQQRKRAFWREHVRSWAVSGLSKAEYGRQHGLAAWQLGQWAARYPRWTEDVAAVDADAPGEALQFIKVPPAALGASPSATPAPADDEALASGGVFLHLGDGQRIELCPGFCAETLERALQVLGR